MADRLRKLRSQPWGGGLRARAYTSAAPDATASSSSDEMSLGSCWPSSSIVTTQSPDVAASPAIVAACWPKFRDSQSVETNGWRAASDSMTCGEPSTAPSHTRMTSPTSHWIPEGVVNPRVSGTISAMSASKVRSPRYTGTMIDSLTGEAGVGGGAETDIEISVRGARIG